MAIIKKVNQDDVTEYICQCNGRNYQGKEVFDAPVDFSIIINGQGKIVEVSANCPYNTGGHGERCKAAHPHKDKIEGREIPCPYAFSLPYAENHLRKQKANRILANRDLAEIARKEDSLLHHYLDLFE